MSVREIDLTSLGESETVDSKVSSGPTGIGVVFLRVPGRD